MVHEDDMPESHHIDHLIPRKHGGQTVLDNLAFACAECNLRKGTDFATIDPHTLKITLLFNPRHHVWREHFRLIGARIEALTPIGEKTATLLQFNRDRRLLEREALIIDGHYPMISPEAVPL
ncbi:MAG: HNH endonuclease [Blastocatellia bacterium]